MTAAAERPETTARISMRRKMYDEIVSQVLSGSNAEQGIYLACDTFMHRQEVELMVRDYELAPRRGMQLSARHISAHPSFIAGAVAYAGQTRGSIVVGHSHPFSDESVQLTQLDREGESDLLPRLQKRIPYAHHGTMIFGRRVALTRFFRPGSTRALTAELTIED